MGWLTPNHKQKKDVFEEVHLTDVNVGILWPAIKMGWHSEKEELLLLSLIEE